MWRPRYVAYFLLTLLLLGATGGPLLANGGKGKKTVYKAAVSIEEGVIEFTAELERIMFRLNSVNGKYKVIRIKIQNRSDATLRLSSRDDRIDVTFEDDVVSGILRLGAHDSSLWDSFDADLREDLVYPRIVEAEEEENVFVFIPAAEVDGLPLGFSYVIHGLPDRSVILRDRSMVAEH